MRAIAAEFVYRRSKTAAMSFIGVRYMPLLKRLRVSGETAESITAPRVCFFSLCVWSSAGPMEVSGLVVMCSMAFKVVTVDSNAILQ